MRRATLRTLGACVALIICGVSFAQDAPGGTRDTGEVKALVERYCGACHAAPHPGVLPKRHWPAVVRSMVEIMQARSGRAGLSEQQMRDITAFYYGSSPEELPLLPYLDA